MKRRTKSWLTNVAVLGASGLLCLAALELLARVVFPSNPFSPFLPLRPYTRLELTVDLPGLSPKPHHTTNRWGLRGDEPPQDWEHALTMVTVGGSTTQCFYLDDKKTWPYLLQEKLKATQPSIWVGNGGIDGQTTRAHLIFMRDVVRNIKPDWVIFLIGINDLTFSLSDDARLYGSFYDKSNWKSRLFGFSRLGQILYVWKVVLFDKVETVQKAGHSRYTPKALDVAETEEAQRTIQDLPGLEEYRHNIRQLIAMGKAVPVKMLFLTQPLLFSDTRYWKEKVGSFYWIKKQRGKLSAATYWKLLEIYNQALMETSRQEGVEVFDLANRIPHDFDHFYDAAHFTEKGAERVASEVAQVLELRLRESAK